MAKKVKSTRKPVRKKSTRAAQPRKKPETLRLGTLTPSFTVNDLQRSLAWYRDVMGFHVVEEWKTDGKVVGAQLRAGSVHVMIGQDDFAMGRDRQKGVGFRMYCGTRQNLDHLAGAIKARGGQLAHEPTDQPWGSRDFAVVDPDGFKITISQSR
jgi:uncharacterized glyoxalase superfamily protein PhnB